MIFKHRRTGLHYRTILEAFDVSRQVPMMVYMAMSGDVPGAIFTRELSIFFENFEPIYDPQENIKPKEPHP